MQLKQEQKILFVINPTSGGIQKNNHKETIENFYKERNETIHFFELTGKDDTISLQKYIQSEKPKSVVAVGGDGTVALVVKLIIGTKICMGIIPAGSANGMAKELGISENTESALEIIYSGQCKTADVLEINKILCLHLSDIGLNAQMIKYFEEGDTRGKYGYAKVALKALWLRQKIEVSIDCKGKKIKRNAFMVVLANASKYGTGAVINPSGNLYDGLFEVIIIRKISLIEIFKMWFRPRPFDPKKIEILQAEAVEIRMKRRAHFQIDGEYIGKTKLVKAKVLHAKLHILIPQSTSED